MAYDESDGHVTDDVTLLWKVKLVTPIRLEPNISKTVTATIANYQICCEAVRSAILETAWLLVGLVVRRPSYWHLAKSRGSAVTTTTLRAPLQTVTTLRRAVMAACSALSDTLNLAGSLQTVPSCHPAGRTTAVTHVDDTDRRQRSFQVPYNQGRF